MRLHPLPPGSSSHRSPTSRPLLIPPCTNLQFATPGCHVWLMACAIQPSVTPCLGVIVNDWPSLSLTLKLYPNRVRAPSSPSRNCLTAPKHATTIPSSMSSHAKSRASPGINLLGATRTKLVHTVHALRQCTIVLAHHVCVCVCFIHLHVVYAIYVYVCVCVFYTYACNICNICNMCVFLYTCM